MGLLKYLFSVHVILFRTLPSGMYVIRVIDVTKGERKKPDNRKGVGRMLHIQNCKKSARREMCK